MTAVGDGLVGAVSKYDVNFAFLATQCSVLNFVVLINTEKFDQCRGDLRLSVEI